MRYYSPEDDIYFFGFSRGAYTARFLAEMLDHVGLLSAGNEELTRFAWKTFSKWKARKGGNSTEEKQKDEQLYRYMKNFRETFSRPVRRIRFLGLFDTVNSVPRFESAFLQRSKFPYTARSSAKIIRHAVSIDERRAKFRQDLVTGSGGQPQTDPKIERYQSDIPHIITEVDKNIFPGTELSNQPEPAGPVMTRSTEHLCRETIEKGSDTAANQAEAHLQPFELRENQVFALLRVPQSESRPRLAAPIVTRSTENIHCTSRRRNSHFSRRWSDLSKSQDVEEVWFPGGHADIGGGWPKMPGENWPLSHTPLVWMVHEAEKAGLKFDPRKITDLNCCPDKIDGYGLPDLDHRKLFHEALHQGATTGFLHDNLKIGGGLPMYSVISWKMMEWLPFRRMDLKKDGSWNAITWPLPRGETRDIPDDAEIHVSAIRRMQHDEDYRPGNLIVGGGGRGLKVAPKKYGIGEWDITDHAGDPIKEVYGRKLSTTSTLTGT